MSKLKLSPYLAKCSLLALLNPKWFTGKATPNTISCCSWLFLMSGMGTRIKLCVGTNKLF